MRRRYVPDVPDEPGHDDYTTHGAEIQIGVPLNDHNVLYRQNWQHHPRPNHAMSSPAPAIGATGLSARDNAILQVIARLQFVTAQQIVRLFYRPGSLEYARGRLKRLTDHQYLLRLRLPSAGPGNTPWVYSLAGRGWAYLRKAGILSDDEDAQLRFRPAEHREHSWLFLTHSLAVTDILAAALLLPEFHPGLALRELRHERVLRRLPPVKVTTLRGETVGVIPDGFLDFVVGDEVRLSIVLELDRGTVEREAMQRKFRSLLAYADGPYQTVFHSSSLTYAIATTAGTRRCEQLRAWCERVLQEVPDASYRRAYADLFLFTALPPSVPGTGALDPEDLFLRPVWAQPLVGGLVPLLDLPFPTSSSSGSPL